MRCVLTFPRLKKRPSDVIESGDCVTLRVGDGAQAGDALRSSAMPPQPDALLMSVSPGRMSKRNDPGVRKWPGEASRTAGSASVGEWEDGLVLLNPKNNQHGAHQEH